MPKIHPEDGTRVLAVASHLRFPAVVALDRWGLTQLRGPGARRRDPVAFLGWDARLWGSSSERVERLIVRVRRAIVRFRPALVVLVVPARKGHFDRAFRAGLRALLADLAIPHVIRRLETAWLTLVGGGARRVVQVLANLLTDCAFPQLDPARAGARHRRLRWYALALALVELARRHPRQASALLERDIPAFSRFIQHHELRLHPAV